MLTEEVLKMVFPFLDGVDLSRCMSVCKQWKDVASDDYFWKCLCAKRWPSFCKKTENGPPSPTHHHKLYRNFHKRPRGRKLPPPRISFDDLEFFIDIWSDDDRPIFSKAVPGAILRAGLTDLPIGIPEKVRYNINGPEYKMTISAEPRFTVPATHNVSVSVLVRRRDSGAVACIIDKSAFDYMDLSSFRALAFDFLELSPVHPFVSGIRAWISLLFVDVARDGVLEVFGIQMDFCDAANSEEEVLWLLDMLDWK